MSTTDDIREHFSHDIYATDTTGIRIVTAESGHAVCELPIREHILNANGVPMGGALFTLGDFTFAVAANACADGVTVARSASITYLAASKGTLLTAEAKCIKAGRRASLYDITITDDTGAIVAHMTGDGFTLGEFVK